MEDQSTKQVLAERDRHPYARLRRLLARGGLPILAAVAVVGASAGPRTPSVAEPIDLVIRGGTTFTGEKGDKGKPRDIGIDKGRILFVRDASPRPVRARRVIDAKGLYVTPGFIDPHTHSDLELASPSAETRAVPFHLTQGVTTIVIGNDGFAPANVMDLLRAAERQGIGVNVAALAGFGGVRQAVLGAAARAPSSAEREQMKRLVAAAMCKGAFGLSAGLYYAPQSFATTDEIVELAREAATRGGIYDTHLRDESSDSIGLIAAVREALEIGRRSGAPVHISHIKAQGVDVHGKSAAVIAMIEAARRQGLDVTADQYPWTASGTTLSNAFIPRSAMDGGTDAMRKRLSTPSIAATLKPLVADNIRRRGGPEAALITSGPRAGTTLKVTAETRGVDPADAVIELVATGQDAGIASFNMIESDVFAFAPRPWVMTGSDASTGHPRKYGTFPYVWRRLVQERNILTPAQFVRRSTGATADLLHLDRRGYLRPGYHADIAVFDPRGFAERASYKSPRELSVGMRYVLVNGTVVVEAGSPLPALAGKALFHRASRAALCTGGDR